MAEVELPNDLGDGRLGFASEEEVDLQPDLSYTEHPIRILEEAELKLRNRAIKMIKVQWSNHTEDEATWEREDQLRADYPELFTQE